MRRAAVSAAANIVEGSARVSEKDFARFLDMAFSSARELGYHISLAHRLGYLTAEEHTKLESSQGRLCATVAGLRDAIRN
jgi:four helix bundle protein